MRRVLVMILFALVIALVNFLWSPLETNLTTAIQHLYDPINHYYTGIACKPEGVTQMLQEVASRTPKSIPTVNAMLGGKAPDITVPAQEKLKAPKDEFLAEMERLIKEEPWFTATLTNAQIEGAQATTKEEKAKAFVGEFVGGVQGYGFTEEKALELVKDIFTHRKADVETACREIGIEYQDVSSELELLSYSVSSAG